jgi:hypothetical protein
VIKARAFAKNVTQTTNYSDSHQINLKKIEHDHFVSKLGEEAVKHVFEGLGQHVTGPDYSIYQSWQKSWQADLFINHQALAVKTQSSISAKKFQASWLFQNSEQRRDSILQDPNAWVCFVSCDESSRHCTVYLPCQIKDLHFREPKLEYLRNSKKAVYLEDLLSLHTNTVSS